MKKILSTSLLFLLMVIFVNLVPMRTNAADPNIVLKYADDRIAAFGNNGIYFDYISYGNTYPDLLNAFGYNRDALWNHYKMFGVYENRVVMGTTTDVNVKLLALNIVTNVLTDGMSDRDKVLALHDWIVNNTRYDYDNYLANTIPDISYHKEGVLLNHIAVCAGYSEAFSYLAKLAGLRCEYVTGHVTSGGGHAWNRVEIDGVWLYVDTTWDDPVMRNGTDKLRYDYFLIPEEVISRDHIMERIYTLY